MVQVLTFALILWSGGLGKVGEGQVGQVTGLGPGVGSPALHGWLCSLCCAVPRVLLLMTPKSVPGWFGLVPKLCLWLRTLTCGVCSSCCAVVRASGGVPPAVPSPPSIFVPLRLFGGSPVRVRPTPPSLFRRPLIFVSAAAEMRHPLSLLRRSEWRVDAGLGRTNLRQCVPRDLTPCRPSLVGGGAKPRRVPSRGQPRRRGLLGSRHQAQIAPETNIRIRVAPCRWGTTC